MTAAALALRQMILSKAPRSSGRATFSNAGSDFAAMLDEWRAAGSARVPFVMGIVNVTPDSFFDGGRFAETEAAIRHARRLAEEGAAILDVGGESTRKDAEVVPAEEELRRVLPVIEAAVATGVPISIDTMKAAVAEAAIHSGATIVNDVRGLQGDPDMAAVVAQHGAGVIAMHNPAVLGSAKPLPGDPVEICLRYFERTLSIARDAGIQEDRIVLDPGFGFGKSPEQNVELLRRLPELGALGFPILVGTSRKSFIGKVTGRDNPDRLAGTLVTSTVAALSGAAAILRVHDVAEHVEAMRMAAAILGAPGEVR
jgi:dihydropteroate synthase